MKKTKIFFRTFFVCIMVGILVEVIWFLATGEYEYSFIGLDIWEEISVDIILSSVSACLLSNRAVKMKESEALKIIKKNSCKIEEDSNQIIGKVTKWKRLFIEDLMYDKTENVLVGPYYLTAAFGK